MTRSGFVLFLGDDDSVVNIQTFVALLVEEERWKTDGNACDHRPVHPGCTCKKKRNIIASRVNESNVNYNKIQSGFTILKPAMLVHFTINTSAATIELNTVLGINSL